MAHSPPTQTPRSLGALALANLSLGAAFGLSSIFSTGAKLTGALGVKPLLRLLQPYQQHLLLAFVSYWLPAVFIFLLVRLARLDRRLRPSTVVQSTIFGANLLLVLYVAARTFASTVEGGGASFVVASLSPYVFFPAWILLAIGFAMLGIRSLGAAVTPTTTHGAARFAYADSVLVGFALLVTLGFAATLPIGKAIALSTEFARLCKGAEAKVLEEVPRAKGVALLQDSFSTMSPGQQAETRPLAVFLLNQSMLGFVERPATKESGIEGRAKFERMTTVGERVLRSSPGSRAATKYAFEPVEVPTAEYVVRYIPENLTHARELGLGGARIEVSRRTDDHLIAYAQYYWSNTEFRACPEQFHGGLSVFHFITNALNVRNPDGPK